MMFDEGFDESYRGELLRIMAQSCKSGNREGFFIGDVEWDIVSVSGLNDNILQIRTWQSDNRTWEYKTMSIGQIIKSCYSVFGPR